MSLRSLGQIALYDEYHIFAVARITVICALLEVINFAV